MGRPATKRVIGTILFVVILVAVAGFLFLLFADTQQLEGIPGTGVVDDLGRGLAIALVVGILLMVLLIVLVFWDRKQKSTEEAEAFFIPEGDRAAQERAKRASFDKAFRSAPHGPAPTPEEPPFYVYDLWTVPIAKAAWDEKEEQDRRPVHPFYFPRSVKSGLYVNDYVVIDPKSNTKLKLRTLLAGAEEFSEKEEEEAPRPSTAAGKLETSDELPGDAFVRELEERQGTPVEEVEEAEETTGVFYDYPGDIHDVIDVEGIGPTYADRLKAAGVATTARLCYMDAEELASTTGISATHIKNWQAIAELMKVSGIGPQYAEALGRAGITGIAELKRRKADRIADQINEYLDGLETNVLGSKITGRRVEGWQDAAKDMRRVRQKVPVK